VLLVLLVAPVELLAAPPLPPLPALPVVLDAAVAVLPAPGSSLPQPARAKVATAQ
jgi:hypothetical protein